MIKLISDFMKANEDSIDEAGIKIPKGLSLDKDGGLSFYALALGGTNAPTLQLYACASRAIAEHQPTHLIFGWDRFCKPGQGTTMEDALSVHYWDGVNWYLGIMEYQKQPAKVMPINWENPHWQQLLTHELHYMFGRLFGSRLPFFARHDCVAKHPPIITTAE